MDKEQKQLSIKINSKKVEKRLSKRPDSAEDEVAAALDKTTNSNNKRENPLSKSEDAPPQVKVLQRPYLTKKSIFSRIPRLKHLFVAGLSATMVGVVLGFIMLKLLSGLGIDDEAQPATTYTDSNSEVTGPDEDQDDKALEDEPEPKPEQVISYSFAEFTPNVVQTGKFSTKEKAQEWNVSFQQQNVNPYIWERDGYFYVFVGIALTKDNANQLEGTIQSLVPEAKDAFDKAWIVLAANKEITEIEGNWVKEGMELWENVVSLYNNEGTITDEMKANLSDWYNRKPNEISDTGENFSKQYRVFIDTIEKNSEDMWEIQSQFISILKSYENYLLNK